MKAIPSNLEESMRPVAIQIMRWLKQPEPWRYVGFVSTIVGLVCYALSSSFNHLFGEWNLFKIFLYSAFSLFLCLVSLFVQAYQHSPSLRFKAHSAFLVLIITSLYSHFADKAVNGKPDAYTLVAFAAFAIMSLSLSRQTHCGFEVDVFYFFLAYLTALLLKVNLGLAIVGIVFSYALIILRSSLDAIPDEHHGVQDENSVAIDVDSMQLDSMMQQFKTCIGVLQQDSSNLSNMPPPGMINDLHEVAKPMLAGGFGKECSQVYSSCRGEFLEESISRLGLQKLSIEDVHKMWWQDLEDEMERWIKASNVALKILFPSERRLCDRIFFGFSSAADLSFMEVCRGSTIQLLNFVDAVATGSRSPERLFRILDVFETLRDLIPEFESLFSDQYSLSLRNEAITIWKRLGEAIRGIFMELESMIRRDPAKMAVSGGGLHPITRYVMNYLRAACRSRQTLEQVFENYRVPPSSLSVQMHWIMELLESNLEAKSKIYKDSALCFIFLMNNGRYIIQKTKDSELGTLLGDDWIRKHATKVRQYHVHYQRSSWNEVVGILKLDNNGSVPPNGLAKSMKEKLKSFNGLFEETCRIQSSWFVFDEQLREEIRISLEELLLPAYENFIGRFQSVPDEYADNIKYGTEDIKARLNDLFQGNSGSAGSRK